MRQEGEPSVEEILESIKKVIARDNREAAQAERRRRETDGLVPQSSAAGEPDPDGDEVLDLGIAASEVVEGDEGDEGEDSGALTNDEAASAMRQSLAALAMLSEPPASPQIVRSGETSLEGMARDMLRPMLAQWLDAHLPDIVERMVKAEISRIAGKKR